MAIAAVAVNAEHTSRRLILGGEPIPAGTKTYTVGIRETINGNSYCGGVLIDPLFALTVKVCVKNRYPNYVSVGSTYINQTSDGEQIEVASVHFHPQYNPTLRSYDFVLLKLAKPSKYKPVSLPNADNSDIQTNMTAKAMGWGWTTFPDGEDSNVLLGVGLRVWGFEECNALFSIDNSSLCAGGVKDQDTCVHDNGGPLVKEPVEGDGGDVLIGVMKWGLGCGDEGYPSVFSHVAAAIKWIDDMISNK